MRSIIQTCLQFRFLIATLAAVLLLVGGIRLRDMPVDVLPEFAPPFVEVQTEALGLSAAEVEELVTFNLEELLHGVPWLQTIRSRSVPGLSSIILVFKPGTDVMRARQMVQERIALARFIPNVSKTPVILQPLSATSRVMIVGFSSTELSPLQLGVLARWKIRPALMGVPGVANVAIWGQRERQLQVRVDPQWLRAYDVSLDQIIKTAGNTLWVSPLTFLNASTAGSGGWFDTPQQRFEVRHVLPISAPQDLAQVAIYDTNLRLGDVAEVVEDHQPLIGEGLTDAGPSLLMVVEKFPGTNTLEVTRGLDSTLNILRPALTGVNIDATLFRATSYIDIALANVSVTLFAGVGLAVLALLALFFHVRTAFISAIVIPLSLVAAALVLQARGATLNMMTLAGLIVALGVIVDEAVVDPHHIARRLRQARREGDRPSAVSIVVQASAEMRRPILFATLIGLLTVVPIFVFGGVFGSLFQPLVLSYALAVVAAMLIALLITPALSLILLSRLPATDREPPLVRWLQRGYSAALTRALRTPLTAPAAMAVLVVAGIGLVPFVRQEGLLPPFQEPQLMIAWEGGPGTSGPEMARITNQVSSELRTIPGITNVGAHVGRAVLGDEVVGINAAKVWVGIAPGANYDATVAAIHEVVDRYPGLVREVQSYTQKSLRQVLTGSTEASVVRIFGTQWPVLRAKALEVQDALSKINGIVDLQSEVLVEEPHVEIQVDLKKAQAHGINPGDVRRAASTLVNGIEVGSLFEQQKAFDVIVWSTPQTRNNITALRELLIDTPSRGHVMLEDVADVRVAPTLNAVNREGVSRRIDVSFNVANRDLDAVTRDVEATLKRVSFPLEYHAELLGENAERRAGQQRVIGAMLIAALGVFLLLQAAFQSWRLASLAFVTLPWALVGGLFAAALTSGGSLSLGSVVGLLAVLAIATRSGILLVSHLQYLEREEGEPFGYALVVRGTRERLAPMLITFFATALALVPLVAAGHTPGHEIGQPMAVAILGGLVTSTLINLFVLPALYLRVAQPAVATARQVAGPATVPATAVLP
jgi:CzcA family heavy metal efflux pump